MRLATEASSLETGGVEAQGIFRIKATGKAFRILIDGLYSNKIGSIVRELLANAFDSHKSMRNPAPFYVHRPTALRPEFFVRDYGVGMTHDKVMNLYSTLFESDKDGDNDLVGMFGLGSKSPFAYTDSFYVTCYDGVTARHYGAAIGEGGVPQIILLKTEPVDEPLGVRVGFHVEDADFKKFETAISRVALGFDPMFETNSTIDKKHGEVIYSGKGWTCYEGGDLPSTWNVRQGCVIYPLEGSAGGISLPYDNRKYLIEAPIGTIEVTTSREQVAYSPAVVKYLKKRLDAVTQECGPLVWEKVKDIENVAKFFGTVDRVKPQFVHEQYKHPFTGLTSPQINLNLPACLFKVHYDSQTYRWGSDVSRYFNAQKPAKDGVTSSEQPSYFITDISRLLDPAREERADFSLRERRRILRITRMWLESKGMDRACFWLGVDWTDEYLGYIYPDLKLVKITVDDLLEAVPKNKKKLGPSRVRGVGVVKPDGGEQQAIKTLEVTAKAAWITADHYRRDSVSLTHLAKKFGIAPLYVASSVAYKTMEESGVAHLTDAIDTVLRKKYKTTWLEWSQLSAAIIESRYYTNYLIAFAQRLVKQSPDSFARLSRARIVPGELVGLLSPFLTNDLIPYKDADAKGIKLLTEGKTGVNLAKVARIEKLLKQMANDTESPAIRFLSEIAGASNKAQLDATTDAIIAVFRAIPSKIKFKEYK